MRAILERALLVLGLGISALSFWIAYDIAGRERTWQLICVVIGTLALATTIYGLYRALRKARRDDVKNSGSKGGPR